uniref:hypothetical protein n=1 Tax=uncultured Erythrobacter sp. TaxID=263913 RepID=UPI0026218063|nr:hypothetical protein [uncultured Erythrobacter sp.]
MPSELPDGVPISGQFEGGDSAPSGDLTEQYMTGALFYQLVVVDSAGQLIGVQNVFSFDVGTTNVIPAPVAVTSTSNPSAIDARVIAKTDTVDFSIAGNVLASASVRFSMPRQTGDDNVTLSATCTDADNDPITYQWLQTAGPSVILTGSNTASPTFTSSIAALNGVVTTASGAGQISTNSAAAGS